MPEKNKTYSFEITRTFSNKRSFVILKEKESFLSYVENIIFNR
ncbi:MAG: hypothetical protein PHU63_02365 [Candidatus ainarchaeum sp.]|nr:hypothetical protein [Candidatus ainarchaeum sp.]